MFNNFKGYLRVIYVQCIGEGLSVFPHEQRRGGYIRRSVFSSFNDARVHSVMTAGYSREVKLEQR